MKMRNLCMKFVLALTSLLVLLSTVLTASCVKEAGEIKLGALLDLTGALSGMGQGVLDAVKLAVQQVNEAGGIGGRPVALYVEDGQTDPESGYQAVKKLVGVDGCKVIVGPMISGTTLAIGDYILGQNAFMISPSATSADIALQNFRQLMFRTVTSDALQARAVAQVIAEGGYQRVAILAVNNSYGVGLASGVSRALNGKATVVGTVKYDPTKADFSAELQSLKGKAPDCVVHVGYQVDGDAIYKQALAQELDSIQWVATDGVYANATLAVPEAAAFMASSVIGTRATAPEGLMAFADFSAAYKAAYGVEPGVFCENAYDATRLALSAMKKAGSTDGARVAAEVMRLAQNYAGASGSISLAANGDRVSGDYEVWKVVKTSDSYAYQRVKVISLS